jgi:hypothetical protein
VDPTDDAFRALARSSPWLWRTLHFTHADARGRVEAWVRRPGELLVRAPGQHDRRIDDRGRVTEPPAVPVRRWPHEVTPTWRPDGLVEARPSEFEVEYGDPMYESYDWVAMLDPVELSHHTEVSAVREQDRLGRRTWWARLRPQEGYDPTCGCCPLLWSFISERDEHADDDTRDSWLPSAGTVFPDAYDVALDVATGVVVELSAVGSSSIPTGHRLELLDVDADLDVVFAG